MPGKLKNSKLGIKFYDQSYRALDIWINSKTFGYNAGELLTTISVMSMMGTTALYVNEISVRGWHSVVFYKIEFYLIAIEVLKLTA